MKAAVLFLTLLLGASAASAQTSRNGLIIIEGAWARIVPGSEKTVSVYFDVLNTGDNADALISATSPVATKVTLFKGTWKGLNFENKKVPEIPVKASRRTIFRPSELEVTLTGITGPIDVGDPIPVTLIFRGAGDVSISPAVSNQLLGNRGRK